MYWCTMMYDKCKCCLTVDSILYIHYLHRSYHRLKNFIWVVQGSLLGWTISHHLSISPSTDKTAVILGWLKQYTFWTKTLSYFSDGLAVITIWDQLPFFTFLQCDDFKTREDLQMITRHMFSCAILFFMCAIIGAEDRANVCSVDIST